MKKRILCFVLALALLLGLAPAALAAASSPGSARVNTSAAYIYAAVPKPSVGSIGGEWAVLGLARSGYSVPEKYYQDYYAAVEQYVKDRKGVLDERKYTEYSRVIVALAAIGKDAANVGGYDLTRPLADFDKVVWQGLNGPIWALIALDTRGYAMPTAPSGRTQATRQKYIDYILSSQLDDGGWNLMATPSSRLGTADPDITGMALQALAKYQPQSAVKAATDKALDCLSAMQSDDGGFTSSYGYACSESAAQVVVALCELGIPLTDARFVKNGKSALDGLLSYRSSNGSFVHSRVEAGNDLMSSEQGLYALVAAQRAANGQNSLYRMSDAISVSVPTQPAYGLPGKDPAVKLVPVTAAGTTFPDVAGHANKNAVEALAARGIINGYPNGNFGPSDPMNRAQFATITVRALGMTQSSGSKFPDVPSWEWYPGWISTATAYGIVNGYPDGNFGPTDTITREQAATMVARAAKLCGMDPDAYNSSWRDCLASFSDYMSVSDFARGPLAFCYDQGILDGSAMTIQPQKAILRCEIAQMIYNMLDKAKLL